MNTNQTLFESLHRVNGAGVAGAVVISAVAVVCVVVVVFVVVVLVDDITEVRGEALVVVYGAGQVTRMDNASL